MVDTTAAADFDNRAGILKVLWTAMGRPSDLLVPDFLTTMVRATSALTTIQLAAACEAVVKSPPKAGTPLLSAVLSYADRDTKEKQRKLNAETEPFILPPLVIDNTRKREQLAILERWKRRASGPYWTPEELELIRQELEADSPKLAADQARVRSELAFYAEHRRFPNPADRKTPREPGAEG